MIKLFLSSILCLLIISLYAQEEIYIIRRQDVKDKKILEFLEKNNQTQMISDLFEASRKYRLLMRATPEVKIISNTAFINIANLKRFSIEFEVKNTEKQLRLSTSLLFSPSFPQGISIPVILQMNLSPSVSAIAVGDLTELFRNYTNIIRVGIKLEF